MEWKKFSIPVGRAFYLKSCNANRKVVYLQFVSSSLWGFCIWPSRTENKVKQTFSSVYGGWRGEGRWRRLHEVWGGGGWHRATELYMGGGGGLRIRV